MACCVISLTNNLIWPILVQLTGTEAATVVGSGRGDDNLMIFFGATVTH